MKQLGMSWSQDIKTIEDTKDKLFTEVQKIINQKIKDDLQKNFG